MLDTSGLSALLAWPRRLQHSQLLSTVFDLPELTDVIFSHLSKGDLVQWARVNKKWHHAVIPFIWRDMSTLTKSQYRRLTRMIINDYQKLHHPSTIARNRQQSFLAKYCPLIRTLGRVPERDLKYPSLLFELVLQEKYLSPDDKESTAEKIFRHFLIHCTHLHTLDFDLTGSGSYEPAKVVADTTAQHLRELSIRGSIHEWAFNYLLSRCSTMLETLDIAYPTILVNGSNRPAIEIDEAEQGPLSSLRRLTITCGTTELTGRLSSLWGKCESVEALHLNGHDISFLQLVPTVIGTFLPKLNTITIDPKDIVFKLGDEDLARLLSASRPGWRSVGIMGYFNFGERSWQALSRHTSTLENIKMVGWYNTKGVNLKMILSSFPRLQTFVTLDDGVVDHFKIASLGANEWIHQDPLSGTLIPWLCEYSLTDLRIKISGIPRPDVTRRYGPKGQPVMEESYPGEGRIIQRRVYERLSRFVNLEVLCLGSTSCCYDAPLQPLQSYPDHQYECLEMSLESGLDQLEGLKRLKMLNVSLMAIRIAQKEAQWMAEQWPRLREIHGLENRGDARKARQWLKRKSPRIVAPLPSTKE